MYTRITAPIAGRVGLRLVDPGNIVQANSTTALVVITQLEPITVIFSIAEDQLSQIQQQLRKGKKLTVEAYDRDERTKLASGTLLTLDNVIDPTTGTLKLKAIFDNKDGALFPSQFVNIKLLVDTQHNVTLIPSPAIQRNAQGAFAYVIKNGQTASLRSQLRPAPRMARIPQYKGLNRRKWSQSTDSTDCSTGPRLSRVRRRWRQRRRRTGPATANSGNNRLRRERVVEAPPEATREADLSESVSPVHFTAGSDVTLDGGDIACGFRRLSAIAGIRAA